MTIAVDMGRKATKTNKRPGLRTINSVLRGALDEVTRTTTNPILVNLGLVLQPGASIGTGELKSFP